WWRASRRSPPPTGSGAARTGRAGPAQAAGGARRADVSAPLVVIGAGGTAGHVVPALAVADALRAEGARVVFVGGERAERELIPGAGYEMHTLKVAQLARRDPVAAARAVAVAARAVGSARRLIGRLGPAAALGAGGYVAGPVGLAAVTRRVPLVLMEADSHLGLTNRL